MESWLDKEAKRLTGIDDGWENYYRYFKNDLASKRNGNVYILLICKNGVPFAVICFALTDGHYVISEFFTAPEMRGRGCGVQSALRALQNAGEIIGRDIPAAQAVIFPNNIALQIAFEKAGGRFDSAYPDGDAWY